MQFDNQKTTIRISLWKMFLAIFFAVLIIFFLATSWFNKPFIGLERYELILISAGLYLSIIIVIYILDLNYIYFNDDGDQIVIRYFPIRPLGRKKRAIQVPKISLAGFEVKKSLFGLKKFLVLHQKTLKGAAKYPAISITSLTNKEFEIITGQLKKYVRT